MKTELVAVRTSEAEKAQIERYAAEFGCSLSAYLVKAAHYLYEAGSAHVGHSSSPPLQLVAPKPTEEQCRLFHGDGCTICVRTSGTGPRSARLATYLQGVRETAQARRVAIVTETVEAHMGLLCERYGWQRVNVEPSRVSRDLVVTGTLDCGHAQAIAVSAMHIECAPPAARGKSLTRLLDAGAARARCACEQPPQGAA